MEIHGEHRFDAPRQSVWDLLMSPDSLRSAIPGCTDFRESEPGVYEVTVKVSLAAITGVYTGRVSLVDQRSPDSFRLVVDGSGKAGRAQASADVQLREEQDETVVTYTAEIRPQGAIARLGNRLLASAGNLLAGQFFKSMERQILEAGG